MQEAASTKRDQLPAALPSERREGMFVEGRKRRALTGLELRDRIVTLALAAGFLATVASTILLTGSRSSTTAGLVVLYVVVYSVVSRIEFEVGPGSVVPTELVLVPMLFALPLRWVPFCVAAGLVLGGLPDYARRRVHRDHIPLALVSSWHAYGPALVLIVAAPGPPTLHDWPVYVAALAAQLALDLASSVARNTLGLAVPVRSVLSSLGIAFLVDLLLAPIGFLAALASVQHELAFLLVLPLVVLLRVFALDRRARIDRSLALFKEARSDPLTGLGNRLAWDEALAELEPQLSDPAKAASVLIIDLDGLKAVNDSRGHDVGDLMIQAMASVIRENVGWSDLVARVGGDEFAVLIPHGGAAVCQRRVRRLADAVAAYPDRARLPLAASIGHASCPPERTLADAVRSADDVLYEQKRRSGKTALQR